MLEYIIPAAASFLGNIIGGSEAREGTREANQANIANQNAINAQNVALQKEFAQNGIRWKVADAEAAGLHPLAALGAQTVGFAPISVGTTIQPETSDWSGRAISDMGQNIGRAIHATQTAEERAAEVAAAAAAAEQQRVRQESLDRINFERHVADLDHMFLQNAYLASQIKRLETSANPPMPGYAGTGVGAKKGKAEQFGSSKFKEAEITSANPFNQSRTAGPVAPGTTRYRFGGPESGFNVDLPAGSSVSEGLESMGSMYSLYTMGRHNMSQWMDRTFDGGRAWYTPQWLQWAYGRP